MSFSAVVHSNNSQLTYHVMNLLQVKLTIHFIRNTFLSRLSASTIVLTNARVGLVRPDSVQSHTSADVLAVTAAKI